MERIEGASGVGFPARHRATVLVAQRLRGGEDRLEPPRGVQALPLEVARDEVKRAGVPEHLGGTHALDRGRVAAEALIAHVEGGQDPGVQEPVPELADALESAGPGGGSPQDDLPRPWLDPVPAVGAQPAGLAHSHPLHVDEDGDRRAGGAAGRAPVHARERRAGPQVVEPGLQDVPGEERQVTQVLERMDAPGPQPVLVEERPAIRNVLVHELEEAPEAPQAVLLKPPGGEPLAGLQLVQEPERRLALEPLVEGEEIARDESLVHRVLFSAWLSSSSA